MASKNSRHTNGVGVAFNTRQSQLLANTGTVNPLDDNYLSVVGGLVASTTIANHELKCPAAGVLSNLQVYAAFVPNANCTITMFVNGSAAGSPSSMIATITASTPGWYADATNTVTVAKGDLITFRVDTAGLGTLTLKAVQVTATWFGN